MTSSPHTHSRMSGEVAEGVVLFSAVILLIAGLLGVLRGIMAIVEDAVFVITPDYVFQFDLTSWGWIHLILGLVAVAVSVGLFKAAQWARIVGIVVAALLIVGNFLSLPYFPIWSLVGIAFCVLVIWGLCTVSRDAFTS